jgi:hypothetical protein
MGDLGNYPPGAGNDPNHPAYNTEEQKDYEIVVETKYIILADDENHAREMWEKGEIAYEDMVTSDVTDITEV